MATATPKVTLIKITDEYNSEEWAVEHDGSNVGYLSRERDARWADGARRGLVVDRSAPYDYDFDDEGRNLKISIPAGSTLHEAKRIICAALA